MIIQTHRLIGENIFKSVNLNMGFELDRKNIIIGSVLPDVVPKYMRQKHFFSVSYDYILNKIQELYMDSNKISIKEFSLRLGIITHYISDFFCTPHNDREYYKNHFIEHMQSESKLHLLFAKEKSAKKIDIPSVDRFNYESVKALIDKLHEDYEKRGVSYENDFVSTIEAVNMLSCMLISHCIAKNIVHSPA